jgi:hypothetical protein
MADGALAKHLHETTGGDPLPPDPADAAKTAAMVQKVETPMVVATPADDKTAEHAAIAVAQTQRGIPA